MLAFFQHALIEHDSLVELSLVLKNDGKTNDGMEGVWLLGTLLLLNTRPRPEQSLS